jgi:carboxymethylenebutenolidase
MPVLSEERIGSMRAALALPDGEGPHPGVVVVHEAFGLNDDIRRIASRFAAEGYAAVAPDLYSGGPRPLCLTRTLVAGFVGPGRDTVLDQLASVRTWLGDRTEVDEGRLAIIGFCMGGGFALAFAAKREGVKAASVNYGMVPKDRAELAGVCPVVASYGADDKPLLSHGRRLEEHLSALGVPHDYKLYDGVAHSFMSFDNAPTWMQRLPSVMKAGYSEAEAEDSWRRILAFFAEHVR